MSYRAISLAALAVTLLSGPAWAGEFIEASIQRKRGPERVSKRALKPHAALTAFELSTFGGADMKVHAMVVRGGTGGARFELTDGRELKKQGVYDAKAKWYQDARLAGRTATVRKRCRVRCLIPLPHTNGRWVLGGFSLRRPGSKQDFVLRLAVQLDASQRNVEVVFRDKGRDVDFDAIVDVVSVPKPLIAATETVKGHVRSDARQKTVPLGRPRRGAIPLLGGFDVRFLNSDHKFRILAVRGNGNTSTRSVMFWDARPDDPFEAALQLVYLKPAPNARRR